MSSLLVRQGTHDVWLNMQPWHKQELSLTRCCCCAGPRLMLLKYKLTLNTYRLANLIFHGRTIWRVNTKPLYRAHSRLTRQVHPLLRQLTGSNLSTAEAQLLAQALALVLPLIALMVGMRMLGAAWQRRPWRRQRQLVLPVR
jgi:hypothetical protein